MKTSKAFKKYEAKLKDKNSVWTEQDIIYFRKAIGVAGMKDRNEVNELINLFMDNENGYYITREHNFKGQQYILNKSYKKNGQLRKNQKFSENELEIIKNLSHHTFVGLQSMNANRSFYDNWYLPIYRAHDHKGNYVDYVGAMYELIQVTNVYYKRRTA